MILAVATPDWAEWVWDSSRMWRARTTPQMMNSHLTPDDQLQMSAMDGECDAVSTIWSRLTVVAVIKAQTIEEGWGQMLMRLQLRSI